VISAAIIHCPKSAERAVNVMRLLEALPTARVVLDQGDGAKTMLNGSRTGCWPLARRAWEAHSAESTHHLVLEDDAELCEDFEAHLSSTIEQAPGAVLSLFRGRRDCSVGTVMPVHLIAPFLTWTRESRHGERLMPHHDHMITEACIELGWTRLYTAPSLVEQRQFPSLLGHDHISATWFERSPSRVALEP